MCMYIYIYIYIHIYMYTYIHNTLRARRGPPRGGGPRRLGRPRRRAQRAATLYTVVIVQDWGAR